MKQENENKIKFEISKKYLKQGILFVMISLLLGSFYYIGSLFVPKIPEYAVYKACTTIKHHEYEESIKYVNIDKIIDNTVSEAMQSLYNDPELKNNPFAGFAYMLAEALKEKMVVAIKDSYKELVKSSDNVFGDISEPQLIYFLTVKSYKEMKLTKLNNSNNKVVLKFSDNNKYKDVKIVLEDNGHNWEIVEIKGYEFWEENENSKK